MRSKFSIKNPIFLIFLTAVVSSVLFLLLYGIIKSEKIIHKKMIEVSTADIISIAKNNIASMTNIFEKKDYIEEIKSNAEVRTTIEKKLELLITPNIKYAYLLYKDDRGIFRFLVDGAKVGEKAFLNQKFDIDNEKWLEIFKTKKRLIIEDQHLQELSISYLLPILNANGEVELILAIDFSVKKVQELNEIIKLIKIGLISIIILVVIFLFMLLIQTFKYLAIKKTAYIDKLTNVFNRNYLYELEGDINLNDYILAILDIDHFKAVNDNYGHDVGDKILQEVAQVISTSTRNLDDIVVRYGGEEFVVFAKIKRNHSLSALNVIERILESMREHKFYYTESDYLNITVSIGVNLSPHKAHFFSDAFKLADKALYNAKDRGRNNIQISDEINLEENNTTLTINEIKNAIDEDKVVCHFQEIINYNSGEVCGYEALLKIIDENGKILSSDVIMPVIEGTFVSKDINKKVLNICYEELLKNKNISISISLTSKDLSDDSMINVLKKYALEKDISNRLGIQIVETEDLFNSENIKNNLILLKSLKYKILIDNFASGYKNFKYLTDINVDYIKIDGEIVSNILENKISFLLIKNIVSIATELGIKTIAKNVNSEEIHLKIKSLKIDCFEETTIHTNL